MPEDKSTTEIQTARRTVSDSSPLKVKLLALRYGITQGQVRGLLMSCGDDEAKLEAAAERLRKH